MERDEAKQVWEQANASFESGDYDGAIAGYSRVFHEYGNAAQQARAAHNIGLSWSKQGGHEGAMEWWGHWLGMPEADQAHRPAVLEGFYLAWKQVQSTNELFYEID